jgi:putative peptidoglycan lipid II flippase
MRVMLLSAIIFAASGVIMGALNARQHFLLPAIAGSVYNLGIIAGALLFRGNVMGLAYGVVLGAAGHMLIQLPALFQKGARFELLFSLRVPGVRQVLYLMAPRVLGLSFSELTHVLTQLLAQSLVLGSIRALDLGWKVMSMPMAFLGQAVAIAAFPTFSMLAAEKNLSEMRRILADTLRLIIFLGLPAAILLAVLRKPIITLLFEYGTADAASTEFIASALFFYAIGLVALAIIEVVARAFFALEDTTTPVVVGGLQLLMMATFGLALSRLVFPPLGWPAFGGLALGHSLANIVESGLLLWLLRRKMGGVDGRHMADGLWRMALAGVIMIMATLGLQQALEDMGSLPLLLVASVVGSTVYFLAAWLLRLAEVRQLLALLKRSLQRATF